MLDCDRQHRPELTSTSTTVLLLPAVHVLAGWQIRSYDVRSQDQPERHAPLPPYRRLESWLSLAAVWWLCTRCIVCWWGIMCASWMSVVKALPPSWRTYRYLVCKQSCSFAETENNTSSCLTPAQVSMTSHRTSHIRNLSLLLTACRETRRTLIHFAAPAPRTLVV